MIILKIAAIAALLALTVAICIISGKDMFSEQNV